MPEARRYQTGKHLEAFLLLLIKQRPDHGGALIARLAETLPDDWTIDGGRVYRMLRDLEAEGALVSQWVTEDSGAPIRIYRITPTGDERLLSWKDEITVRRNSLNTFLALWDQVAASRVADV